MSLGPMNGSLSSIVSRDHKLLSVPPKTKKVAEKLPSNAQASLRHKELTGVVKNICNEYGCTPQQIKNIAHQLLHGERERRLF